MTRTILRGIKFSTQISPILNYKIIIKTGHGGLAVKVINNVQTQLMGRRPSLNTTQDTQINMEKIRMECYAVPLGRRGKLSPCERSE